MRLLIESRRWRIFFYPVGITVDVRVNARDARAATIFRTERHYADLKSGGFINEIENYHFSIWRCLRLFLLMFKI